MRGDRGVATQPVAWRRVLLLLQGIVFAVVNAVRWLLFVSWRPRPEQVRRVHTRQRASGCRFAVPRLQLGPSRQPQERAACALLDSERAACALLESAALTPARGPQPQVFTADFASDSDEDGDELTDLIGEGERDAAGEAPAGGVASPRRRSLSSPTRRRSLSSPSRRRSFSRRRGDLGVLPMLHWRDGDATGFSLRSASYLLDKRKAPSQAALLTLAAVELWQPEAPTEHICAHPSGCLARGASRASLDGGATPFTLAVNFINPGSPAKGVPYTSLVVYFQTNDRATLPQLLQRTTPLAASLRRFLDAGDAERAGMLKIIASVVSGPLVLRASVPRTPVVIGKHVRMVTHVARDRSYVEIDLHVSSSSIGDFFFRNLFHRAAAHVVTELVFLFEGSRPEELPEQAFGVALLANIGPDLARPLPPLL